MKSCKNCKHFPKSMVQDPCRNCLYQVDPVLPSWEAVSVEQTPAERIAELEEALTDIRDLARTGLKLDIYPTEEAWLSHKVNKIAGMANRALHPPEAE